MVKSERYTCNICNTQYSSASSIWNHRTKKHNSVEQHEQHNEQHNEQPETALNNIHILEFNCRKCNKTYKHQQSRSRHEIKCNKNTYIFKLEL
jgi:hypothetical protein